MQPRDSPSPQNEESSGQNSTAASESGSVLSTIHEEEEHGENEQSETNRASSKAELLGSSGPRSSSERSPRGQRHGKQPAHTTKPVPAVRETADEENPLHESLDAELRDQERVWNCRN